MKKNINTAFFTGILSTVLLLLSYAAVYAQNGVRIAATTGTADGSAMLDVVSTTKGFLVPRLSLVGPALTNPLPVTSPADGLLVYNLGLSGIAAKGFYYWNGTTSAWVQLSSGTLTGSGTPNYIAKWTTGSNLDISVMYELSSSIGVSTTTPASKLHVNGTLSVGAVGTGGAVGMAQITSGGASPINNRLTYGTDGSGWKFAIAKNQGGTVTDQVTISDNGNVGIANTTPSGKLHVTGEMIRTNTRVDNAERYPVAHSSAGADLLGIDPSWSNAELQAFFNSPASGTFVQWNNDATAPAGWCIQVTGAFNAGGEYGSGFPYIPVETGATYYMECWIRSTSGTDRHYMGSNEYNQSFATLGGNPGTYGYWVMNNTLTSTAWTKVSGYITGFHASNIGAFEVGTKYWTPMALFNYGTGGTSYISGWTVTKVGGGSPLARRNYQPYGTPTYVWDGSTTQCSMGLPGSPISVRGGATIGVGASYCTTKWNNKWMFTLGSLSTEAQTNSTVPANGVYLNLPVTEGVNNTLLLSFIDFDRWSSTSVWACNQAGTTCTKLMRTVNNSNSSSNSTAATYTLGPYNNPKETGGHAWQNYPISSDQVTTYASGGNVKFLLTSSINNGDGATLFLSGFAVVPNHNGLVQNPALNLHWGLNGNATSECAWNTGNWNNDGLAQFNAGSSYSVHVKVMDITRDVLVTFYEYDAGWYGGCPYVTVGNDGTVFRPARGIQGIAQQMYDSKSYMGSMSFVIPASIVAAQAYTPNSGVSKVLKLNVNNSYGNNNYYIRGIDTEIYY